ncbi:NAD(P)H-quinone oxidoreductase subunit S, chloroplastic [Vigna radiata var. radiata]|uniref:NAD(P)H-quinone oxidoreductase subunit S, chloroplastic n=1 Tax=Vigna radiata var. radiata TaxID=3916 RepID=A0A1S3TUW0_VIGRR|nr:NAD(P)H-quinone oxidoreductase subunit S, chloroplastic [Vigna radiata var. radiata]
MATFATLHGLNNSFPRSQFLGQEHLFPLKPPPSTVHPKAPPTHEVLKLQAKFNILEMMGGRGLCNGEKGIQQELKRQPIVVDQPPPSSSSTKEQEEDEIGDEGSDELPADGFEKEMMGLTGGFPGGEKGLKKFIEKNSPPKPDNVFTISS